MVDFEEFKELTKLKYIKKELTNYKENVNKLITNIKKFNHLVPAKDLLIKLNNNLKHTEDLLEKVEEKLTTSREESDE